MGIKNIEIQRTKGVKHIPIKVRSLRWLVFRVRGGALVCLSQIPLMTIKC